MRLRRNPQAFDFNTNELLDGYNNKPNKSLICLMSKTLKNIGENEHVFLEGYEEEEHQTRN